MIISRDVSFIFSPRLIVIYISIWLHCQINLYHSSLNLLFFLARYKNWRIFKWENNILGNTRPYNDRNYLVIGVLDKRMTSTKNNNEDELVEWHRNSVKYFWNNWLKINNLNIPNDFRIILVANIFLNDISVNFKISDSIVLWRKRTCIAVTDKPIFDKFLHKMIDAT